MHYPIDYKVFDQMASIFDMNFFMSCGTVKQFDTLRFRYIYVSITIDVEVA